MSKTQFVPPGMGRAATHSRNRRKKLSKQLQRLKEAGLLAEDAVISDFQAVEQSLTNPVASGNHTVQAIPWQDNSEVVEDWQSRIELSAIECEDDALKLPPPPFPFEQRWHWSQKRSFPNAQERRAKKRRRRESEAAQYYYTEYAEENEYGEGYTEDGFGDLQYTEAEPNEQTSLDQPDLPSLPEDPTVLPLLSDTIDLDGAIIIFKRLIMNNWQPVMTSWQTARVEHVDGDTLQLSLAYRDRPRAAQKQYDEEGKRIWGRFEMPESESEADEDDEGFLEFDWSSLVDPRLLQARQE